jgi:tRNA-specific adenosine deaminase 1
MVGVVEEDDDEEEDEPAEDTDDDDVAELSRRSLGMGELLISKNSFFGASQSQTLTITSPPVLPPPSPLEVAVDELFRRRVLPHMSSSSSSWTVLCAIAVTARGSSTPRVLSVGLGTRCSPGDPDGHCVRDMHAEALCRRALVLFLMEDIARAFDGDGGRAVLVERAGAGVKVREGARLDMLVTHAPCGDAAIFELPGGDAPLQSNSHTNPNKRKREEEEEEEEDGEGGSGGRPTRDNLNRTGGRPVGAAAVEEPGRAQAVGVVRHKPGRGPEATCVSCSDKIARWTALGLQGSLLARLIETPVRLDGLFVVEAFSEPALRRAIHARVAQVPLGGRYASPKLPELREASSGQGLFADLLRHGVDAADRPPSRVALAWRLCPGEQGSGKVEVLQLQGMKQGATRAAPPEKTRAAISSSALYERYLGLLPTLGLEPAAKTREDEKATASQEHSQAKETFLSSQPFQAWPRNKI